MHLLCECLAAQERKPGSGGHSPPSRMCSRGRLNTSRSSSTEWGGPRHLWVSPGLPRPRARPAVGGRRRRESRLTHRNRRIYPSPASRTTSRSAPSTWPATSRTGWLASYNLSAVPSTRDTTYVRVPCTVQDGTVRWMDEADVLGEGHRPVCTESPCLRPATERLLIVAVLHYVCSPVRVCVYLCIYQKR